MSTSTQNQATNKVIDAIEEKGDAHESEGACALAPPYERGTWIRAIHDQNTSDASGIMHCGVATDEGDMP
jgi:hypothetical protein